MKIEDDSRYSCMTLKGHEGAVTGMSLCGDRLVTCSADKTLKVWDVEKQKVKKTLSGHTTRINSVASDQKSIISGSRDGTVHIWDLRTGEITDTEPSDHVPVTYVSMGTVPRHAMIGRQGLCLGLVHVDQRPLNCGGCRWGDSADGHEDSHHYSSHIFWAHRGNHWTGL